MSARHTLWALVLFAATHASAQDVAPGSGAEQPDQAQPVSSAAASPVAPGAAPASSPATSGDAAPPTATEPPAPATDDAQAEPDLTAVELAALGVNVEHEGLDTGLHASGFMDVTYTHLLNPTEAAVSTRPIGDEASFMVGRLNFYADKNITQTFRMMTEIRFTYAPNGAAPLFGQGADTSYTEVADYTGTGATFRWGGIVVERAYGEWSPFRFLSLRLGSYLTPYGIWNVDHGSPVYVPVMRPYAVNGSFFPERQTGVELFGRAGLTTNLAVRYHLTLSNGLGPISEYRDLDSNKAIGGRLALEYVRVGTLQLGASTFYGLNTAAILGIGLSADGTKVVSNKKVTEQAYITAVAADVLWKYKGLHLQGEWVGQRTEHTDKGHTPIITAGQAGIPLNAMAPDTFNWAGYALAGYRLPWWGIMPFATLEYQRSSQFGVRTETVFTQAGLNIRPADAIVVKVQYMTGFAGTEATQVKIVNGQVAWAF